MDCISIGRLWVNRTHLHFVSERAHDPQISSLVLVWSQSESHYCFGLGHNCLLPAGLTAAQNRNQSWRFCRQLGRKQEMTVEPALPAQIDQLPDGFNVIITSQMHCAKRISWLRNATASYRAGSTCMRPRDGFDRRVQGGRWLCAACFCLYQIQASLTLMDTTFTSPVWLQMWGRYPADHSRNGQRKHRSLNLQPHEN